MLLKMEYYTQFDRKQPTTLFECKTAVAIGCFDGIHKGHKKIIQTAIAQRDENTCCCVFTFDTRKNAPSKKIGSKNLLQEEQKLAILQDMGVEAYYCPEFDAISTLSAEECVDIILKKILCAKVVVVGTDFKFGKNASGDINSLTSLCKGKGIEVIVMEKLKENNEVISSSCIRQSIAAGDIKKANSLLGYDFGYILPVITGNKIGRSLNFPTINQKIPQAMICPKFGVYASKVLLDNKMYQGVTNIGIKPTIGSDYPLAETYIENFHGDLYGKIVKITLKQMIRDEKKFANLNELKEQIRRDCDSAEIIFGK